MGGTVSGCNRIVATVSKNLPSYNQVGEQLKGSPVIVCTVTDKEQFHYTYTMLAYPLVVIAVIHALSVLK